MKLFMSWLAGMMVRATKCTTKYVMTHAVKYAAPREFHRLAGRMIPWFAGLAIITLVVGLYLGLVIAPADYRQGDVYRILFIHVAAAWMSMFIYFMMAVYAGLGLVLNTRLSSMMASALAPTGALFTFLTLWTGALWGKPTWGTWWVWDARLTSELLLLFLYLGFMALQSAIADPRRAARAGGVLALIGLVNLPVIYFSVYWWNTLHQGASVSLTAAPKMAGIMVAAMLTMTFAFWMYAIAVALVRVRGLIVRHEARRNWVANLNEATMNQPAMNEAAMNEPLLKENPA